jgi:hypothetical protein
MPVANPLAKEISSAMADQELQAKNENRGLQQWQGLPRPLGDRASNFAEWRS